MNTNLLKGEIMKIYRYLEVTGRKGLIGRFALHRRAGEHILGPFRDEAIASGSTLEEWIDDAEVDEEWALFQWAGRVGLSQVIPARCPQRVPAFKITAVLDVEEPKSRTVMLKRIYAK
jgi:hypothetical protein